MRVVLHGQPSLVPLRRLSSLDVHVRLSHLSRCRSLVLHTGRLWQTTTCADVVHRRCDTTKHRRHHANSNKKKKKKKEEKKKKSGCFCAGSDPVSNGGTSQEDRQRPRREFLLEGGILGVAGGRCAGQVAWTQAWLGRRWNGWQLHLVVRPNRWNRRRGSGNDARPMHLNATQDQGRNVNLRGVVRTRPHQTRPNAAAAGPRDGDDLGWKPTHILSMHGKRSTHSFVHHTLPKILAC